jgi:hypothetical protein
MGDQNALSLLWLPKTRTGLARYGFLPVDEPVAYRWRQSGAGTYPMRTNRNDLPEKANNAA